MWVLAGLIAAVMFVVRRIRRGGSKGSAGGGAAVLLLAAFGVALAQTIVLAALTVFARELDVSATGATWLLTAFMLASAVATPVAGRLGDLFGHRRVIVTGLALLLAGSVVSAVSTHLGSYTGIVAGRVLQGLSGGVFPCAFGLARQRVPAERLGGVVAALSAMFGVGGALGLVAAGPLVDVTGPAALFWLVAALALLALAGMIRVPSSSAPASPAGRVDLAGATLLAGTLVALLLAVSQGRAWGWSSPGIIALFGTAVALATAFGVVERRAAAPLVDLRLLIGPRLLTTNVATLVVAVGMFAAVTLLPLFVQTPTALGYGFGYSPARTGLLMAPMAVCMLLAAPLAARVSTARGTRAVFRAGAVLAAIALAGLGVLHEHIVEVVVWCALLGLAYGLAFASLGGLVVGAVGQEQTGAATGINTILRTVGGAIGSVLAAVIVASSATAPGRPAAESGYTTAFLVSGAIALGAAAMTAARGSVTTDPVEAIL
ncbi:MFS transporter [Streptomyces pseudovenezuelae]|uniref:MFS family permease n=1 Tax=Streptomyces pseudovenezuelae TaxID=67350 RepID=A0ABT6LX84_9ACTN|nr:MFS transporter [Streptomyces pseudovenezuelae]MDH6220921.1 MFS family permease [Streptomyces pseudovenezuelae]